tara:strand:- start:40 stop:1302 length:1263 start_codon:yes stop_codon:yes gene_type:complete
MNKNYVNNLLNQLHVDPIFTENDKNIIIDIALQYVDEYVEDDILGFSNENFHSELETSLHLYLEVLFENILSRSTEVDLIAIIREALHIYFICIVPRRVFRHSVRKLSDCKISKLDKQITILRNIPQPQQRTEEWYNSRHNMITASSAWKVFGTQSSVNQLIYEKCKPYVSFATSNINTESPLHWGQKYEPVSIALYEQLYNTTVEDFGCIRDDKYKFLGASPDGINVDKTSPLFGRMLEIKNIVNRVINGNPKKEYWIQMQLQMSVCKLNECDFLETKFFEYDSYNDFIHDSSDNKLFSANGNQKGVFLYFNENDLPKYIYPPIHLSFDELDKWINNTIATCPLQWIRTIYWRLDIFSCVLVCRNRFWFEASIGKLQETWEIIERERVQGYEHRAPIKRNTSNKTSPFENKCMLVVKTV